MTNRRKMTAEEKAKVREHLLKNARQQNPGAVVEVIVDDFIDDDGLVQHQVLIIKEKEGPTP